MISYWVFGLMALAALYAITIFSVRLIRYLKHKWSETELLDQEADDE